MLKKLENKFCVNTDNREIGQAYLRTATFVVCAVYSLGLRFTPFMQMVATTAFFATIFWIVVVWRNFFTPRIRHIGSLIYDCAIIGLVMVGLGRDFIGLYGVLLMISIGYGIRYRNPFYLKLGIVLTVATFSVSVYITHWSDFRTVAALIVTLIFVPSILLKPISMMIQTIKDLDEANRVKAKFISNVSHDLLTPISAIVGYCEASPKSSEIKGIRVLTDQLSRQIRAILGKTISSELAPNERLEDFSPKTLLDTISVVIQPLANSKNIKINMVVDESLGMYFGPADAITSCLMNLANNAVKYSDGNQITVGVKAENDQLHFHVSNNGTGIPESQQSQIFDRFHRSNRTDKIPGLGIGLTIVKDTIDRINGEIFLESSDHSTCFKFSVPVSPIVEPKIIPIPEILMRKNHFNGSLLFVDDEYAGRKAWSSVLRSAGHYVHIAASGKEALESIESGNQYSLYILDYRMPEMTGIELAKQIRKIDDEAKILLVSADVNTDPELIFQKALSDGSINAALGKPINLNKLLTLISELQNHATPPEEPVKMNVAHAIFELANAVRLNDQPAADAIAHQVKGSVSFLKDDAIFKAITSAKTPAEVLNALRAGSDKL